MDFFCKVLVGSLVALAGLAFTPALRGQLFSLDDNSAAPLTTPLPAPFVLPFPPFGFGAEDPFGILMPPPGLAPSPSLGLPGPLKIDGTILSSGVAVHLPPPFDAGTLLPHNYIDALSNNSIPSPAFKTINLLFSIDRKTSGVAGSHSFIEAGFNQQPGDIYVSSSMFAPPGSLPPALPPGLGFVPGRLTPPKPGTNRLLYNQDHFGLTAGLPAGPGSAIPAFTPAPPIGPGTHDNLDAFELRSLDTTGDMIADVNYFFSINPVDAVDKRYATFGAVLFDSADVWIAPVGFGGGSFVYATAALIGLAPIAPALPVPPIVGNDIDALVVWDVGSDGIVTPGVDFALFSLAPGSVDLTALANSPADIFFTDFSGSYAIYASAADLGLRPADNVDALEIALSGDADLSGNVTLNDLAILASNYNVNFPPLTLNLWSRGDFDGNGVVGLSDLVVFAAGNGGTTGGAGAGAELPSVGVPEPASLALAALAIIGAIHCRRRQKLLSARAASMIVRCGGTLIVVASWTSATQAATVAVTTVPIAGGLFQHLLNVAAFDGGAVLGFEILVQGGGINQVNPFGLTTLFADDALPFYPFVGATPAQDTHVLYNSTDGFNVPGFGVDSTSTYRVATGVAPATPLVVGGGAPRNLFQLVTIGNIALTASRLRINVGGGGGDQVFDGLVLNQYWLFGDFNLNGRVDGADYVWWRKFDGTLAHYNLWRSHFGQTPGSGAGVSTNAAVPEPATLALLMFAAAVWCLQRGRSAKKVPATHLRVTLVNNAPRF